MLKFIIISLALLSVQLFAENQKVSLQLAWKHQFQFAGFYIAKELGYYNDVGIDLDILEYKNSINQAELIEDGKVDFAIGRSSILIEKCKGKDIVALGAILQHSPMMLLVRKDSNITSIHNLKNKKIMIPADVQYSASIITMLYSNNITKDDIIFSKNHFSLSDFIDGTIDATTAYTSNEPIILENKNIDYKIFHPKDYGFDFYSDILFTSSKFIKNNPKLTQDFYEATIKGWEYAFNNIVKTAEIIHKKYNTQYKPLINLVKEGEILKKLAYDEDNMGFILDKNRLKSILDIYKVLGITNTDINFDDFIYEHNSDNVYRLKFKNNDLIYFFLSMVLLFILLLGVSFYFIVHKKWLLTKRKLQEEIEIKEIEIKKQNSLILQQAKMTAMGDMLANIAHQWRQPLNNMSLNISILEISSKLEKKIDKEKLFNCVASTTEQINYLSDTIDVFRNFLISDTKNSTEVELKDIIAKTNSLMKDSLKHENITLVEDIQNHSLLLNQSNLTQVFINILNNAKDAMNEHNVDIDNRYIFINTFIKKKSVIISIKDSAGGIKEDIINNIFEPYFSTKFQTQGTGIGLYIVHEIIIKLNGIIEVKNSNYKYDSKELRGAEFIITLPIKESVK